MARSAVRVRWWSLSLVFGAAAVLCAQQPNEKKAEPSGPTSIEVLPPVVLDPEGGVRLSLEHYKRLVAAKSGSRAESQPQPEFGLTQIRIEGEANGQKARMRATVRAQVTAKSPLAIPLRAPGPLVGFKGGLLVPTDSGYEWWVQGAGTHELRLDFAVPLQSAAGSLRLAMDALSLMPATISSLDLVVPGTVAAAKTAESQEVDTTSLDDGRRTRLQLYGLPTQRPLILEWQSQAQVPGDVPMRLFSEAVGWLISVQRDVVTTRTKLRLQTRPGQFDQFQIRLPRGAKLLDVDGAALKSHTLHLSANPQEGATVTAQLQRATAGPVEISLAVQQPLDPQSPVLNIEGFEVIGAERQIGYVVLQAAGDLELAPVRMESVQQIEPTDLPAELKEARASMAFQYFRQPFGLTLEVRPREPRVLVQPDTVLQFAKKGESLEARLQTRMVCSVERAAVSELLVERAGWEIRPEDIGPSQLVDRQSVGLDDKGQVHIRLVQPVLGGQFRIYWEGRRGLMPAQGPVRISLPVCITGSTSPGRLALVAAEGVQVQPHLEEMPALAPIRPPSDDSFPLPDFIDRYHGPAQFFRLRDQSQPLVLNVEVRPRQVQVQSHTRIRVRTDKAAVEQTFAYHVANERLARLEFKIPMPLIDTRVFTQEGQLLIGQVRKVSLEAMPEANQGVWHVPVDLPEPRMGSFEWSVHYELPLAGVPTAGARELTIPLVMPAGATLTGNDVEVRGDASLKVSTAQLDDWRSVMPSLAADTLRLEAPKAVSSIRLAISARPTLLAEALISQGWLRTTIGTDGQQFYEGLYRIRAAESVVALTLPPEAEATRLLVDGQPARYEVGKEERDLYVTLVERGDSEDSPHLQPEPVAAAPERLLQLEYSVRGRGPLSRWGGSCSLAAPRFRSCRWRGRWYWQLLLPPDQYVFVGPASFTAELDSRGRYHGPFWELGPARTTEDLRHWIAAGPALESFPNEYLFSRLGDDAAPDQPAASSASSAVLRLRTLTLPSLVLAGAGAALSVGLLLVLLPGARALPVVMTILAVAVLLASLHPLSAVLLLQPAGFGVVLAAAGALIQHVLTRRRERGAIVAGERSSIVSLPSPPPPPEADAVSAGSLGSTVDGAGSRPGGSAL